MNDRILWTAIITPMKEDGSVHFSDLEHLLHRQENAGNGVLILGSTGEGISFSENEKKEILTYVTSLDLKIPVMAGVGGFQLDTQLRWIEYCNQLNIDSFLLVTPLYSKPGYHGQLNWFRSLLDKSEKRCMIYNIPSRTGVKLIPAVLKEIENHPQFWSVKEASGSVEEYRQFRQTVPNIPLYSGDDGLLPQFAKEGCAGLVSVAGNVWPEATHRYVEICLNGEMDTLEPVWKSAVQVLFSAPNPVPAKRLLQKKAEISTDVLRPPLSAMDLPSIERAVESDLAITEWYQNNKDSFK
ncbi:MAG: 4-hydroxy-tetrahydrodipicolinate synthase [Balneolaceae bacterium]